MLSKFWLVNGCKNHGKKSYKKISHKRKKTVKSYAKAVKKAVIKKTVKKSTAKKSVQKKLFRPVKKSIVKRNRQKIYVPEIVPQIPDFRAIEKEKMIAKNIFENNPIKRSKKIMKKVKKAKKFVPAKAKATKSKSHRIVVRKSDGKLRTSKKARIVKRSLALNPMKISAKGLINQVKPIAILGGISVASMIGINKGMEYIPYVKDFTGIKKSLSKVGVGVVGMIAAKKLIKNQVIANGILLGAVISAIADVLATRNVQVATTQGIKAFGVPALQYGRPTAPLGTQSYKGLNGIKVRGVNGLQLPAKVETMQGAKQELY